MDSIDLILKDVPDKQFKWKGTTSLKWKKDLLNFFQGKKLKNGLEIGTNQGWSAYTLSFICNKVYTVENSEHNYIKAQEYCSSRNNIEFILGDAYKDSTYSNLIESIDVCIIDCIHTYSAVKKDINRCLSFKDPLKEIYLVFDDYSHPESMGVREAIDNFIEQEPRVKVEKYIGHGEGYVVNRDNNTSFTLVGPEGIILRYSDEN